MLVKSQQKRPKWLDQSMWEDIDNYYFMANETENTMTSLRVKIKCLDAAEDV